MYEAGEMIHPTFNTITWHDGHSVSNHRRFVSIFKSLFILQKQGKSEGSDSCGRPCNLTQILFKSSIFQPVWPWNLDDLETIGYLFHTTSWFVHHFQSILWILVLTEVNQVYGMDKSLQCSIRVKIGNFLSRVMTLKNNTAHLLCYIKLSASFHSHQWIQTGVTFWKCPIWVKIDDFLSRVTLKFDGWPWKNNGEPFLRNIKLCASFHHHRWIETVTVRKYLNWVLTSVTLTFDLWPWHFAWTSLVSLVINLENVMMIKWREHSGKGVTDRPTGDRTEPFIELLVLGRS